MSQSHTRQSLSMCCLTPCYELTGNSPPSGEMPYRVDSQRILEMQIPWCYEAKEEKRTGSYWELNPGPLAWAMGALTTELQPDNRQSLISHNSLIYCTGGTECFSHTPGSHSVCAISTLLGKISPSKEKPYRVDCCFRFSKNLAFANANSCYTAEATKRMWKPHILLLPGEYLNL